MMNIKELDVLVAEDNDVNQIVFEQVLELARLDYKIVSSGRLAVSTFKIRNPKVVLMDVSMPDMNGKEATQAIRKLEKGKGIHTPIIAVTAHALKGDREEFIAAGMDDYISKPVSPDALIEKIEYWLHHARSNQLAS